MTLPDRTIIDKIYEDNQALVSYLEEQGQISFQSDVDDLFRKNLLLSIASYFEFVLKDTLLEFFGEQTNDSDLIIAFLKNKAIERQYHTYFNWGGKNANSFFGLFGNEFKNFMNKEIQNDEKLKQSIRAFLKLGDLRNQLVHKNFATFPLENTRGEIFALYQQAVVFINLFPQKLREHVERNSGV